MSCIIAVAAPIGGGKTALVNGLAQALGGATTVYFDHYEQATQKSPAELARWLAEGADFNQLQAPGLQETLEALMRGDPAFDPSSDTRLRSTEYVVLEMPLGRAYAQTSSLIDILIWVDIPLDIALARKLRELTVKVLADAHSDARGFLLWLDAYLEQYSGQVRAILEIQKTRVAPSADITVDGLLAPDVMIATALKAIRHLNLPHG